MGKTLLIHGRRIRKRKQGGAMPARVPAGRGRGVKHKQGRLSPNFPFSIFQLFPPFLFFQQSIVNICILVNYVKICAIFAAFDGYAGTTR